MDAKQRHFLRVIDRAQSDCDSGGLDIKGASVDAVRGFKAFAKKRGLKAHTKANRDYQLWQRIKTGRITDANTLAAVALDNRLQKAFSKFEADAQKQEK